MAKNRFPLPFETERLILRAPAEANVAALHAAMSESFDDLHRWMDWADKLPTLEETLERARQGAQRFQAGEDFTSWAFLKTSKDFVLACGLHNINWDVPKFEIGYWCRTTSQGHGYVTEAVRALTRIGFDDLGANRVEIRCDARNERSRKVAELAGYRLEAELHNDQRAPDGVLRNTLIFALLPDEYRNQPVYAEQS